MRKVLRFSFLIAVLCISVLSVSEPQAQEKSFFEGKTITIVVGTTAGGGYDLNARMLARHYSKYIPGNPNIIVTNMPGASDVKSVNYLYSVAPKDGTVIGAFNSAIPFYERMGVEGVTYKSAELSWIGNLSQSTQAVAVWHSIGVKNLDDAKKKEVIMGALGDTGTMAYYPKLLNRFLGTKFRVVTGYQGGPDVELAMERGEVHGRGAGTWFTWQSTRPEWIKDGKIVPLVQIGIKKAAGIENVPLLTDLARNDEERQIFDVFSGNVAIERPFAGPPGVPSDRLQILRRAFDQTMKDPAFIQESIKLRSELDPNSGEVTEKIVAKMMATPQPYIDELKKAIQ
ncbi:MAG: tripartite tricarboxylate transporter family receptor [Rhodospirillales bacterium]|jgi:tripartite-type tricarboxylate transporter receptor subunit TctC|nr:tripartite tricarboxylate transporter family receptor [Rhodospirillales bacterium]